MEEAEERDEVKVDKGRSNSTVERKRGKAKGGKESKVRKGNVGNIRETAKEGRRDGKGGREEEAMKGNGEWKLLLKVLLLARVVVREEGQ